MRPSICRAACVLALASLGLATGCTRERKAQALHEGRASTTSAPLAFTGEAETVDVPGDEPALVIRGKPEVHRPIVHLHGMCEDPRGNLEAWGAIAKEHGTVLALVGDVPCPGQPGLTKWSDDAKKNDARIVAAIVAVNAARGASLGTDEVLLIGESMGAARAESLAKENPGRYGRLVLIGSPQVVSPANVRGTRAVANVVGAREPQQNAKQATRVLSRAGVPTALFELTGASHGEYGPEGERIVSEAIRFVSLADTAARDD